MKRSVVLLGALALLALMVLCVSTPGELFKSQETIRTENYIRQQQAELELAQDRADHEANRRMLQAVFVTLIGLLVTWGGVAIYNWHQNQLARRYAGRLDAERLQPTEEGLYALPDPRTAAPQLQAQLYTMLYAGQMQASVTRAAASAAVPQHLTYSPRLAGQAPASLPQLAGDVAAQSLHANIPTFAQLLDQHRIGAGQPLLLGYSLEEGPIFGDWLDLYSAAVAGLQGTGKTTTLRFLAGQSAAHGARFIIIDRHANAGEDSLAGTLDALAGCFLCKPASSNDEIAAAVHLAADELDRRLDDPNPPAYPLIILIDEFTAFMREGGELADLLAAFLEKVAQEGRKKQVYALISGQNWKATRAGGTELRASLASAYVHRMRREQARMLLPTDDAAQAERLERGEALLYRTSGETVTIRIPLTTEADMIKIAGLLTADAPTIPNLAASLKPESSQVVTIEHAATSSLQRAETDPDAVRAAQLFINGLDPAAIVLEMRGVKSNEGGRYQKALGEVMELLRAGIKARAV